MENTRTLHALDEFAKSKPKEIPKELDDYLRHVAASGDPVYQWSLVKFLFRQKLLNVIMEFYESSPMVDLPFNANMDPFNFEIVKKRLLERYDFFTGVPFTIQRLAELLTSPKKQYNRLDKFLRALEKNIWVVSTREPANRESNEPANLPNGVLSTVLHTDDGESSPEEHQRRSEIFDGNEEKQLLINNETITPAVEEASASSSEEPIVEAESEQEPVLEAVESTVPSDINNAESPVQSEVEPEEVVEPSIGTVSKEEEEEEPADKSEEQIETCAEPSTFGKSITDSKDEEEEDKSEEIVVTEVEECGNSEVVEATIEPTIIEPNTDEEVKSKEERVDLKRKIDDVIDEGEELIASKRLETELPFCEIEPDPKPVSPIEDIVSKVIETADAEKVNTTESVEAVKITEIEGSMESSEIEEEKVEMMVEDTDQAMDVDESSVMSPMVQEDVVELMEASEMGSS